MAKQITPVITEVPVTAEAREAWLRELFDNELVHPGELFVPTNSFYANGLPRAKAKAMLRELCEWLGIKPGYIGLAFESNNQHHPDGRRYTIFVEQEVLHDEFILGGFLAYALTQYLLEEKHGLRLQDRNLQSVLLASASIVFGLGIIIMNGINPVYGWIQSSRKRRIFLLKDFPMPNYTFMLKSFLRSHAIEHRRYAPALTPWAAKRLGIRPAKKPFQAVAIARHHALLANFKTIGAAYLVLLVLGLGIFVAFQRGRIADPKIQAAETEMTRLQQQKKLCEDSLAYDRQYTDLSDIQAVRALNAESARCKSLNNQYESAAQTYRSLLN